MIKWRGIERVDIHFLLSANSFRISNVPALFVSPILIVLQFFTHFRSTRYRTCRKLNKMLSYRRETALQGTLVLSESGRLELRDNILLIL